MIGTIVNAVAIIIGGLIGTILGHRFPDKIKNTVMQGLGLTILLVGSQMALRSKNILLVIFNIVIGGIIGEWIDIEKYLHRFGSWIESKFQNNKGNIANAFVRTSLIYCVGAMAIMGAIQDGLNNDPSTLFAKAMIDGFTAIAFAATMGFGVILSAIPVFIYQGAITIMASWIEVLVTSTTITEMTATGGLIVIGIGLNILEITKIKVGNLLPAIFIVVPLAYFFT
ncbi:hypothetical protein BBF96_13305 [Anoxybacter fermentans]|uniref:DUF554 domain-containing protein n=1 Tax=Anoxybacter fermentans TaxID=1323375 RepID=A0A3Q9HRS4_9FIRM|nr:DUF554 domain-containing protein [Anoxybacter fermentans]AZR74293.1 hypothetical protein BBF96_13305 [Anoxybacter fermentans]